MNGKADRVDRKSVYRSHDYNAELGAQNECPWALSGEMKTQNGYLRTLIQKEMHRAPISSVTELSPSF